MAQNVTINGTTYNAVPAVQIPKSGGGTATFTDVSDTTAVAADVNVGKYIYLSDGTKVQGSQNIYSVTENFTQVASNNSSSRILGNTSYVSEITPTEGYLITSITVTMGGVDITNTAFTGETGSGGGDEGITPTGTINIVHNGTVDVTNYASANVNVPNSYSSSDEGKVVSNGALVSQGSDTVTHNGTVDTTLISSLLVSVSASGNPIENGTIEISSASTTVSFETSLSSITGILIMPVNTPLTGSRTQAAMICLASGSYYKAISIHTNSGGTGWVSPSVYTGNKFSKSGSTVTVTGAYSFRPAVGYVWYAW